MSDLLSCASGIVILSVILSAIGLVFKRKRSASMTVLSFLPLVSLLLYSNMLAPDWPDAHWAFPYVCLLFFLPACGLFVGSIKDKLFIFLLHMVVVCVAGFAASLIAETIFATPGESFEAVRLTMLLLLGSLYLYWVKTRGQRIFRRFLHRGSGWTWAAYAFGPCLGCVLLPMAIDPYSNQTPLFYGLILVFVLWSAAVLVLAILATRATAQAVFDLELARHIIDATTEQAGEIAKMVETSRILRHDCKHHLHVAQILLETGRIQEAREYMLTFGTKCDEGVWPTYCLNPAVNALLNGYQKRCRMEGIDFSATVELPENPSLDSFELCTLLGNLLENALEACRKAPKDQRSITLKGAPQGSQLLISVKNTFDGQVIKEEGRIVSRKSTDGGLGIKSIRAIADRHQGDYVPEWNDNTFTASVMLRL